MSGSASGERVARLFNHAPAEKRRSNDPARIPTPAGLRNRNPDPGGLIAGCRRDAARAV
jgi:hypothetical protein